MYKQKKLYLSINVYIPICQEHRPPIHVAISPKLNTKTSWMQSTTDKTKRFYFEGELSLLHRFLGQLIYIFFMLFLHYLWLCV